MSYDRALTVFSPDGHLFQVEYALEAVNKGTTAVVLRGEKIVVLAVEKKTIPKLQDPRTIRKVALLDKHVVVAFAGLNADARVLIDMARVECQSERLTVEDPVSVEYIARYISNIQQKCTQTGGSRPFGISMLVAGFDSDGTPKLFLTEPSGGLSGWKAHAIGQNSKVVCDYLTLNYKEAMSQDNSIKLALRAILEVVQNVSKNVDVVILTPNLKLRTLDISEIDVYVTEIEKEKEAELEKSKRGAAARMDL